MLVLAIESSCDETSLAFLEGGVEEGGQFLSNINNFKVLSSVISSQIEIHKQYGGVVPEIGARNHAEQIHYLLVKILREARSITNYELLITNEDLDFLSKLDYIFVTNEPGLVSALRVGVEFTKTLQFFIHKKTGKFVEIVDINHLQAHVASCFYNKGELFDDVEIFPHLHLLVSGGHTQTVLLRSWGDWEIVGKTLDDAAGECFDKIGRMLGFSYPGGVSLAKVADIEEGNICDFPIGMKKNNSCDFSFSGLKTAVRYFLQDSNIKGYSFEKKLDTLEVSLLKNGKNLSEKLEFIKKACVSSQFVIVEQLIRQFKKSFDKYNAKSVGLSGGVSANRLLRSKMFSFIDCKKVFVPDISLSGDNAIMVGVAGVSKVF